MKKFALAGNPNCGKTTLFNALTGSTAHVGNWPGVTVDKREGTYKKEKEAISIVDLPGIYSLSPYTPEEVISRNFILDEKPDCVINIVDATNLERNLYLTTQILEMDVPVIIALNMSDVLDKSGKKLDAELLEKMLNVPVVSISALKETNIEELMHRAYLTSLTERKGNTCLKDTCIAHLVGDVEIAFKGMQVQNPLFHSIKLIEKDEIEIQDHPNLLSIIEEFKKTFKSETFGDDLEAIIADERYKYISNFTKNVVKKIERKEDDSKDSKKKKKENSDGLTFSDKVDKVLTHKIFGIPIFILALFLIFHLTFSTDFLFLNAMGLVDVTSFVGTPYQGLFADGGIASLGTMLTNFFNMSFDALVDLTKTGLESAGAEAWAVGLIGDGIMSGVLSVFGFLPQILMLFLFFSILEDSGYMTRVAFILDRIFRKFGVTGRAFMPMIMGFGCSIPAMINTRTLADEKERRATIRVIPFFSCSAKLPILTSVAGAIVSKFHIANPDIITLSMYLVGMIVAMVALIVMRSTTMKGDVQPFIMELPTYHFPRFKSLMIHLWDKTKHFVKKACTIILISNIAIWCLMHFAPNWSYLEDSQVDNSILAVFSKILQPIFTPLGFGVQLKGLGWVFVAASVAGLIAKENLVGLFAVLAGVISNVSADDISEVEAVVTLVENTQVTAPALIAFILFNMTTIPCFAACATARAELPQGKFKWTLLFWIVSSYIVGTSAFVILTWLWTIPIFVVVIALLIVALYFYRKNGTLFKRKKTA
ncbi:MAG TPA: ferrous iron transport protein B [Firmicutes bacterium]|nr:ferrous iron transport protein B [Bacillota bacterium]